MPDELSPAQNIWGRKFGLASLPSGSLKRNERVSDQNLIFFCREKLYVWRESVWKHAKACVTQRNRESWQLWCSWVLLTTTMRRLTYVTYSVALIGCRSIQLSKEAFYFLVRLKTRPLTTAQWSGLRLIFWLELWVWQRQAKKVEDGL